MVSPLAKSAFQDFLFHGTLVFWYLIKFISWVTLTVGSSSVLDGSPAGGVVLLTLMWRPAKNGGATTMNLVSG